MVGRSPVEVAVMMDEFCDRDARIKASVVINGQRHGSSASTYYHPHKAMGRSQVAFNQRARGGGRGRGGGGSRGTRGGGRGVEAASPSSKQRRHLGNHQPDIHEEQNDRVDDDYNTLDDRAEQLLSYGTATSTGVAQFQPSSDYDGEIMFHPSARPSSSKEPVDVAEQMNRLNQRLALLPLKDRLRLPDFILAEMGHDSGTTPGPAYDDKDREEKASSVVIVAPQVKVETKVDDDTVNNNGTVNEEEEEEEENLDDWLDSVIQ
jgi:hypothetical protein